MLILRIFREVQKSGKPYCHKHLCIRFITSMKESFIDDVKLKARKYSKPLYTKNLKSLDSEFIASLFSGSIDKKIFEYPAVLRESDIDIINNHSVEVENFLKQTSDQISEVNLNELRKLELFGLSVPQKYGGAGYNETECTFLHECTGIRPTIARFLGYNENFGCKVINQYGTEEQKEKYLPKLVEGTSFISFAYLENGPLIDLTKCEGYAIDDESNKKYILTAEKKWVHDVDKADLLLIMVKTSQFFDDAADVEVKFNLFIAEKNTPGVVVNQISKYAQEKHLFDVSIKNLEVPHENLLGGKQVNGYDVLKFALSHSHVTDVALCCNIMKQIVHEIIQFVHEKCIHNALPKSQALIQENLASLTMYLYGLESALYLISGRFDSFENPDLFCESILVKSVAIDFLHIAIKKYTEILGRESLKSSGILKEAIKTVQYYTVFDENIEFLKLMCSSEGMVHASQKLKYLIKVMRKPYEHNWEFFKLLFTSEKEKIIKSNMNFKFRLELQSTLSDAADILEEDVELFQHSLVDLFSNYGREAMNNEHAIIKFGEMAGYIYTSIACLSRASSALCYDFHNCENDSILAQGFSRIADAKIKALGNSEIKHIILTDYYENLGSMTFTNKQYPGEHPLTRTY